MGGVSSDRGWREGPEGSQVGGDLVEAVDIVDVVIAGEFVPLDVDIRWLIVYEAT